MVNNVAHGDMMDKGADQRPRVGALMPMLLCYRYDDALLHAKKYKHHIFKSPIYHISCCKKQVINFSEPHTAIEYHKM